MSIHETVKTEKWYYLDNMWSAYFPIDRRLHRGRGGRERARERERLCPSVKLWKHRNGTTSIIHYLHISLSMWERERARERERLHPSVKQWKHRNGTISIICYLHISLLMGDCTQRERLCSSMKQWKLRNGTISIICYLHISLSIWDCIERERGYVHPLNGENTEKVLSL